MAPRFSVIANGESGSRNTVDFLARRPGGGGSRLIRPINNVLVVGAFGIMGGC